MPDILVPPCVPLVPFKLLTWCWSTEGISLSRWVCVWVLWKELLGSPEVSSTDSIPTSFHSQRLWGLIFLALEPWSGGVLCGAGTPHYWDIPPNFLSILCGWGTNLFHICAPPTSLDGCDVFNSIVVRHPFNSISDSSAWWLFYLLVVILMWLMWCDVCRGEHVCLHHHLGQKSYVICF